MAMPFATLSQTLDALEAVTGRIQMIGILSEEFPTIFGDSAMEDLAFVGEPFGQVDFQIYFRRGCVPGG